LDHELGDDAVEANAVVQRDALLHLPGLRILPLHLAGREADEVRDGFGRALLFEQKDHRPFGRLHARVEISTSGNVDARELRFAKGHGCPPRRDDEVSTAAIAASTHARSKSTAMPWPRPTHNVARPTFAPRACMA